MQKSIVLDGRVDGHGRAGLRSAYSNQKSNLTQDYGLAKCQNMTLKYLKSERAFTVVSSFNLKLKIISSSDKDINELKILRSKLTVPP